MHVVENLQADDIAAFSMVASKFPQTLATPYPSTSEAPCPSTLSLAAALGSTKILLYLLTVSGSSKHLSLKSGPNKSGPAFFAASADSLKALKILKDVGVNMLEKVRICGSLVKLSHTHTRSPLHPHPSPG